MAAGEEEQNKGEAKGFAGLSSLVSDVDTTLPPSNDKKVTTDTAGASSSAAHSAPHHAEPESQPSQKPYQAPAQPSSGSSGGKWLLGIAAVIGVLWFIGEADKNPSTPAPTYAPPTQLIDLYDDQSAQATSPAPAYSLSERNTEPSKSSPPVQHQAPSRPEESKPPAGRDLIFSAAQIRYCLAEEIRMDGAKSALDNYSEFDVDRFNAMVADYNSRCGSFRYRSGALERARRDIEPYRIQFRAEGRSIFARGSSTGSLSSPAQPRPAPDATVQAIQRKLNELGYNAGPADGLMGRATRSAIIAFQQDRGMAATGVADQVLLLQLQQVPPRPSQPQPESRPANSSHSSTFRSTDLSGLSRQNQVSPTTDERSSIELACIIAKSQGPAAYNDCVNRQLKQLASAPRTPSMASLSYDERSAIELACITTKSEGAASYNRCLASQIRELESAPRQPSMSGLSYDEKSAIELACITTKSEGAASYNRCLASQLRELESAPRQPNMSGLSYEETSAIKLACITTKSEGAANYNRCLFGQLRELHNAPRIPSLDDLSYQEKSSIQLACITEKSNGAAAYNRCLTLQLGSIRR